MCAAAAGSPFAVQRGISRAEVKQLREESEGGGGRGKLFLLGKKNNTEKEPGLELMRRLKMNQGPS